MELNNRVPYTYSSSFKETLKIHKRVRVRYTKRINNISLLQNKISISPMFLQKETIISCYWYSCQRRLRKNNFTAEIEYSTSNRWDFPHRNQYSFILINNWGYFSMLSGWWYLFVSELWKTFSYFSEVDILCNVQCDRDFNANGWRCKKTLYFFILLMCYFQLIISVLNIQMRITTKRKRHAKNWKIFNL